MVPMVGILGILCVSAVDVRSIGGGFYCFLSSGMLS